MREFKEPTYEGPQCVCCKDTETILIFRERLLEALKQEQVRSTLGFIQYKVLEKIINEIH